MYLKPTSFYRLWTLLTFFVFVFFMSSCKKSDTPSSTMDEISALKNQKQKEKHKVKRIKNFNVRMLAANNNEYGAEHIIPTLQNAWGLTWSSTGIAWISAQAGHVSDITDSIGNRNAAIDPVNISSPTSSTGGSPTGTVFNPNAGQFIIPSGNGTTPQAARFLFVGDDGVVSAWNGTWGHNSYRVAAVPGAAYTGLTLASFNGTSFIYAANFATGNIDVWDQNWTEIHSMPFTDPNLPADYSPFNIQVVGSWLYVMYAKVGADGEEEKGVGNGLVDVYTTNGMFVKRFATGGTLNAPWGVAMAPASFYKDEDDDDDDDAKPAILVGNFGDGHINAYRAKDGKFIGQLSMHNTPITIDGLWAISFAPSTSTISQNLLYFTAGPKDEVDGLFGYISKVPGDD